MSKIYEGGVKLNNVQVMEKIKSIISQDDAKAIAGAVERNGGMKGCKDFRRLFAHSVLDAHRHLSQDEELRKCMKHIMKKYMNSLTVADGEDGAARAMLEKIIEIAG